MENSISLEVRINRVKQLMADIYALETEMNQSGRAPAKSQLERLLRMIDEVDVIVFTSPEFEGWASADNPAEGFLVIKDQSGRGAIEAALGESGSIKIDYHLWRHHRVEFFTEFNFRHEATEDFPSND